jgi:hypothetical protein
MCCSSLKRWVQRLRLMRVASWAYELYGRALLDWMPIPLQALEACIPSRAQKKRQKRPRFSRIELPRMPQPTAPTAVA